jgi:putative membrane protein
VKTAERIRVGLAIGAGTACLPALAHTAGHAADDGWSFDPVIAALLLVSCSLQVAGRWRMHAARDRVAPGWRAAAFWAAIGTLVLALFSPLDARADTSFAWHMSQHLLLMLVAAPLLAVSNAHFVALYAFSLRWRRSIGQAVGIVPGMRQGRRRWLTPWIAAAAFTVGLWLWHAPVMYEAALANRWVHTAEHLVFLLTASIFWRTVATAGDRRLSAPASILLVTIVGLQGNLMAALITLAPHPIYPTYAVAGGLTDQQIAGLIMWVPAGLVYLASTLWALHKFLDRSPGELAGPVRSILSRISATRSPPRGVG